MNLILEQKEFEIKGEGGNWQNTSLWTSKRDEKVFTQIVQIIFSVQ